jgi:DUF2075 family protein
VYDTRLHRVDVVKDYYFDYLGKAVGNDHEALRAYIINIYATLMTRGIHGAFVFVCDPALREYLRKYYSTQEMIPNIIARD